MNPKIKKIHDLLRETGVSANQIHAEIGVTDYKLNQILDGRLPEKDSAILDSLIDYLQHPGTAKRKPGRPTKTTGRRLLTDEQLSTRLMATYAALQQLELELGDEDFSPVLAVKALVEGLVMNAKKRRG